MTSLKKEYCLPGAAGVQLCQPKYTHLANQRKKLAQSWPGWAVFASTSVLSPCQAGHKFPNSERDSTVRRWPCRGGSRANRRPLPVVIWQWAGSRVPRSDGCFGISLGLPRMMFDECPLRRRGPRRGGITCQRRSLSWRSKLLGVKRGLRGGTRCSKISPPKPCDESTKLSPGQRLLSPASSQATFKC